MIEPSAIEYVQNARETITHARRLLEIYSGDRIELNTFELLQTIEELENELSAAEGMMRNA